MEGKVTGQEVGEINFFDLAAPYYDRFMKKAGLDYSSQMAGWLNPVEDMDLLDLGGGTGINAVALENAGARVTIADMSGAMIARARAKGLKARLVVSDAGNLPFPGESFDIVLVSDAWHHFRRQEMAAGEIARVLRPGGRLYIVDFDRRKFRTWLIIVSERILGEPSTFMTPEELCAFLEARGISGHYEYINHHQYLYMGIRN